MRVRATARGPSKPMFMSLVSTSSTSELSLDASALVVAVLGVVPGSGGAPVVEDGLALEAELHLPVHAADHAQQDVAGVVVGRRPALRLRALVARAATDRRGARRARSSSRSACPSSSRGHGAGQVASRGRHRDVGRAEAESAGVAVEDRAEDARRVEARQAQPLDVARSARPARSSRSRRGSRTRRSAGTGSRRSARRARSGRVTRPSVRAHRCDPACGGDSLTRSRACANPSDVGVERVAAVDRAGVRGRCENHSWRCSDEPCVHVSGFTWPCVCSWMRSSPMTDAALSAWAICSSGQRLEEAGLDRVGAPDAGEAVGLELDAHGAALGAGVPALRRGSRAGSGCGARTRGRRRTSRRTGRPRAPNRVSSSS